MYLYQLSHSDIVDVLAQYAKFRVETLETDRRAKTLVPVARSFLIPFPTVHIVLMMNENVYRDVTSSNVTITLARGISRYHAKRWQTKMRAKDHYRTLKTF